MATPQQSATLDLRRIFSSSRDLAAWALVGYVALYLVFRFLGWIVPDGTSFSARSATAGFRSLLHLAMPVLAVLLAVHIAPALAAARAVVAVALTEYAFALSFGLITLLIGLGPIVDGADGAAEGLAAAEYLVQGLAALALMGVATLVVWRARTSVRGATRPSLGI